MSHFLFNHQNHFIAQSLINIESSSKCKKCYPYARVEGCLKWHRIFEIHIKKCEISGIRLSYTKWCIIWNLNFIGNDNVNRHKDRKHFKWHSHIH